MLDRLGDWAAHLTDWAGARLDQLARWVLAPPAPPAPSIPEPLDTRMLGIIRRLTD